MHTPLVTIAIPFYNAENFFAKAIESSLDQNYDNIELLLLDDGSTDSSYKIAKELTAHHKNVKLISQENRGLSASRNRLIQEANGSYFFFLDADDVIERETIKTLLDHLHTTNSDMVIGGSYRLSEAGERLNSKKTSKGNQVYSAREAYKEFLLHKTFKSFVWGNLYKLEILKNKISFPIGRKWEDMYVFPEIIFNCNRISYLDKSLYGYRKNSNGVVATADTSALLDLIVSLGGAGKHALDKELSEAHYHLVISHLCGIIKKRIKKEKNEHDRIILQKKIYDVVKGIGVSNILRNKYLKLKLKWRILYWYSLKSLVRTGNENRV